jgi:hypothetical protein
MSGSGGSSGGYSGSNPITDTSAGGGGGGGFRTQDDCDIFDRTVLNSPSESVLGSLMSGDILDLQLQSNVGPLVAVDSSGSVAGSITSGQLARIARCIQAGHEFIARVALIRGGMCEVEIRPKGA